jgi:hypothetical protein
MAYREYTMRVTLKMTILATSEKDAEDEAWDKIIDLGGQTEIIGIERD